jgi:hypothetical protein
LGMLTSIDSSSIPLGAVLMLAKCRGRLADHKCTTSFVGPKWLRNVIAGACTPLAMMKD